MKVAELDLETMNSLEAHLVAQKVASKAIAGVIAKLVTEEVADTGEVSPETVTGIVIALIDGARMVASTIPYDPAKEAVIEAMSKRMLQPFREKTSEQVDPAG